jgi:hypothetical protein
LCTVFDTAESTTDVFTVEDGAGNLSNSISFFRTRPGGANLPPLTSSAEKSSGGAPVTGGGTSGATGSGPPGSGG